MKKKNFLSASMYRENTIKIPHTRLANILEPDDVIYGHCHRYRISAEFVGYKVTHVAWWGVYAVPTDEMREELKSRYVKGHIKFKWRNISGVIFK